MYNFVAIRRNLLKHPKLIDIVGVMVLKLGFVLAVLIGLGHG